MTHPEVAATLAAERRRSMLDAAERRRAARASRLHDARCRDPGLFGRTRVHTDPCGLWRWWWRPA